MSKAHRTAVVKYQAFLESGKNANFLGKKIVDNLSR
jgi:hypothetical protein